MTPEHLHLILNHLPVMGASLALLPILVGLLTHSKPALLSGLALAALCSWTTLGVMETGEEAYARYKAGPVTPYLDAEAYDALENHEHTAHDLFKVMVAQAVLCSFCFIWVAFNKRHAEKICWLTLLLGIVVVVAGVRIADSGGKIRRPDFRPETSSVPPEKL